MPRFLTAREQAELLAPWVEERVAKTLRLPTVRAKMLDSMGLTQNEFRNNYYSWIDSATPDDLAQGALWYPTGHDWGEHIAERYGVHPDKVHGVVSKTSPQRRWLSSSLNGNSNLGDAHRIVSLGGDPALIGKIGGKSAADNLRQSLRIMAAPDDPQAIDDAFLGNDKNGRLRNPRGIAKTYDFFHLLRDPEHGGAFNYMHQPAVVDSWAGRSMLWSRDEWENAQNGGRPLKYPGRGTGEGLDKHVKVKEYDPDKNKWAFTGRTRPPGPTEIAARVIKLGGGYDRMRNAMRAGAARHDLPFAHEGQAAVWRLISGNDNPEVQANPDVDLHSIDHPEHLYHEMWGRRASGLHVPASQGFQAYAGRRIAAAPADNLDDEDDGSDDDWGSPEDIDALARHISAIPPGWDAWGDRHQQPGVVLNMPPRRGDELLSSVQDVLNYSAAIEKMSIPENVDEDWEGRVWNHIMRHPDGATFRDEPGDGPTDGYMVSLPGTEEKIPFYMLMPEDVGDFARDNADEINRPGNGMGTWSSPVPGGESEAPHLYMDVSHNHDDSWEAAQAATEGDQIGIYDLTHPDYNPKDRTRYVDTPQFVHDQIAKGGSRTHGQRD